MSKLSILLVVIVFTSCTSLKRGYLAKVKNETNYISDSLDLSKIDSIRAFSIKKTDSLLVEYRLHEKEKALRSSLINSLFEQFAIQLNHDRIYTSILQKNSNKKKKNNLIQYHNSLVVLLNSAAYYNSTYEKSKRIRRAFNRGDIGNHIPKNVLQKSKRFLYATKVRKKAVENLQQLKAIDSRIYKLPKTNIFKSAGVTLFRKNDRIINTVYGIFSFIGKTFLGSPSEIKLHKKKEKLMIDALSQNLQPFDIILCRSENQLVTTFVDGYYGHAAIWIGEDISKKRHLKHLLDSTHKTEAIHKHHKGMFEAIRSGVRICSMKKFLDGEEYLIVRIPKLTNAQKIHLTKNAIKQLGKDYDFNFDIESPDEINCTELVYLMYDFINWNTSKLMGRNVVMPDDVFKTALDNKQLEIVTFIKGDVIKKNPQPFELPMFTK